MRWKLKFHSSKMDSNSHILTRNPDGSVDFTARRSTCALVVLGRGTCDLYGLRLWIYGPSGACVHGDVYLIRK